VIIFRSSNQAEPLNQVEALERIHLGNQKGTENGQGAVNDAPDKRKKAANFDKMNILRARNKSQGSPENKQLVT
jgi:hypothetical protein